MVSLCSASAPDARIAEVGVEIRVWERDLAIDRCNQQSKFHQNSGKSEHGKRASPRFSSWNRVLLRRDSFTIRNALQETLAEHMSAFDRNRPVSLVVACDVVGGVGLVMCQVHESSW